MLEHFESRMDASAEHWGRCFWNYDIIFGKFTAILTTKQPNPEDPLNKEVAQLMLDNKVQFEKNVKTSLQGGVVGGRQYPKLLK
jgi:ubiquitin-protein ligase